MAVRRLVSLNKSTPQLISPQTSAGDTVDCPITLNAATGNQIAYDLQYTVNKATSGSDTGLLINQTDTASPGTSLLLDLQVGGTSKVSIDNVGQLRLGKNLIYGSTTGLMFGDGDSGIYESADDTLIFATGNASRAKITWEWIVVGANAQHGGIRLEVPSATNPVFIPHQVDPDTGIGRAAEDQLSLIAGGVEGIRITEAAGLISATLDGDLFVKEQAAASADSAGYGQLWVKNTTPCQLWFTDDAGTDTQIV